MLFPTAWLDEQDPVDAQSRTNRETRLEEYAYRYSLSTYCLPFAAREANVFIQSR